MEPKIPFSISRAIFFSFSYILNLYPILCKRVTWNYNSNIHEQSPIYIALIYPKEFVSIKIWLFTIYEDPH